MLELPEVLTLSAQLQAGIAGKKVTQVFPPSKIHKFCWYNGEPSVYGAVLSGRRATGAEGFGIFVEIGFEGGYKLCINDGVNLRLISPDKAPKNYQLMIVFDDGTALLFTVAMYGGIILHRDDYDNEYYISSRQAVSPFSEKFESCYRRIAAESKPALSLKAFLATEQRFPGIGNGVLQDILFAAGLHPRRKLQTLNGEEKSRLLNSVISVLGQMTEDGGRDTEKDMYGHAGGYRTKMSKLTLSSGCPVCGGTIIKETYLGGSVYYCPVCQPNQ